MGCCNLDCTTVDEVVGLPIAVGIASLVMVVWEMLGGLGAVDGCAKHGDWEEMPSEDQQQVVVVGSEGGSHEGTARTPS